MSDLIVIGFDDEFKADEVLIELGKMQKEHLVDLEDAVVVVKTQKGKLKIKQTSELVAAGAVGGGFWGFLIGLLFMNPLLGVSVGMVSGAVSGALTDVGINDDFIRDLGKTLELGTSAIFMLARTVTPDKVVAELVPFGGKLLRTSLSNIDESHLKAALEKAQNPEVLLAS